MAKRDGDEEKNKTEKRNLKRGKDWEYEGCLHNFLS